MSSSPAAPTPPSLHRVAGRALVVGAVTGGVMTVVVALFLVLVRLLESTDLLADLLSPASLFHGQEGLVVGAVGAGTALGIAAMVAGAQLSLRLRPGLRPLALLAMGPTTGLLIVAASACVEVGPDPEALVGRSIIVRWWRQNPGEGAADLVVVALVTLAVGLPRVLPWRGAPPPWPRRVRVATALAAGPVIWASAWLLERHGPGLLLEPWPFWDLPGAFLAAALGVALGLEAGEAADDWLTRRWRERLDTQARLG